MTVCLHGMVATLPKRHVAEAGLLVETCTVTLFPSTCGVFPEKETVSGPVGGCVGGVGGCVVRGGVPVVVGSGVGKPVEVESNIKTDITAYIHLHTNTN